MPIRTQEGKTPKGQRCLRALVNGHVSLADAQAMGELLQPGQPYHQALVICLVEKGTQYSPESRKYFGTLKGNYKRIATAVTSAVLRASINFMLRLAGDDKAFRMFNTEAEAMTWLDEK